MKSKVLAALALPCALLFVTGAPGLFADDHDKKTDVTITEPVEVPGGVVLQPGTYMFRLMEATGNRHVVEIKSEDGKKTYAIAMTAAAYRVQPTDKVTLTFWEMPSGQPPALRKWFWPSDVDGQEFLYPHKRAAEISKVSKESVPEAPEEQPVANNTPPANNTPAPSDTSSVQNTSAAVTPAPAPPPAPESVTVTQTTTSVTPAEPPADQSLSFWRRQPPPWRLYSDNATPPPRPKARRRILAARPACLKPRVNSR